MSRLNEFVAYNLARMNNLYLECPFKEISVQFSVSDNYMIGQVIIDQHRVAEIFIHELFDDYSPILSSTRVTDCYDIVFVYPNLSKLGTVQYNSYKLSETVVVDYTSEEDIFQKSLLFDIDTPANVRDVLLMQKYLTPELPEGMGCTISVKPKYLDMFLDAMEIDEE